MTIDQGRLAAIRRDHDHQRPPLHVDREFLLDAVETLQAEVAEQDQIIERAGLVGDDPWRIDVLTRRAEAAEAEAADLRTRLANVEAAAVELRIALGVARRRIVNTVDAAFVGEDVKAQTLADIDRALDGPQDGGDGR